MQFACSQDMSPLPRLPPHAAVEPGSQSVWAWTPSTVSSSVSPALCFLQLEGRSRALGALVASGCCGGQDPRDAECWSPGASPEVAVPLPASSVGGLQRGRAADLSHWSRTGSRAGTQQGRGSLVETSGPRGLLSAGGDSGPRPSPLCPGAAGASGSLEEARPPRLHGTGVRGKVRVRGPAGLVCA